MKKEDLSPTRPSFLQGNGDFIVPFEAGKQHNLTFMGYEVRLRNKSRIKEDSAANAAYEKANGNLSVLNSLANAGDTGAASCLWAAPWWETTSGTKTQFISIITGLNSPTQDESYDVIGETIANPNNEATTITRLSVVVTEEPAEAVTEGIHEEAK